jgi:hypothetical protein
MHPRNHYGAATEEPWRAITSTRPTSPTTRTAAAPKKARPRRTTVAVTAGIRWPGPLPSKDDTRVARAQGSKDLTLKGCDYHPVVSKPTQREQEPRVPSIYKDY